jgi:nitrate reductase NapE component
MKRKPVRENPDWNISFWFVVLWPLIVVAIVAIGFLAPALIKTL